MNISATNSNVIDLEGRVARFVPLKLVNSTRAIQDALMAWLDLNKNTAPNREIELLASTSIVGFNSLILDLRTGCHRPQVVFRGSGCCQQIAEICIGYCAEKSFAEPEALNYERNEQISWSALFLPYESDGSSVVVVIDNAKPH
jgi:hypothetical protein